MAALRSKLMAGGLALATLVATAGIANAAPGFATSNVNVRSGPGTSYRVIDTLQRGQRVDIRQCQGSWCFVSKPGPNGWVSANYLSRGGSNVIVRPPVVIQPPIFINPGWNRPPPPRPPFGPGPRPPGPGPRPPGPGPGPGPGPR